MISRIRAQLGPAGFVVAVIALVAALAGGAYAASGGLSGKQKKEVEKISKKFAGKPGTAGANGAPGAKGDAGAPGANGTNGSAGTNGTNGKTVLHGTTAPAVGVGTEGDFYINTTTEEIFGPKTTVWGSGTSLKGTTGFTATLPSEAEETGSWLIVGNGTESNNSTSISFPIPLSKAAAEAIEVKFWREGTAEDPECPGNTLEPKANPGFLCIYFSKEKTNIGTNPTVDTPEFVGEEEESVGPAGAFLVYTAFLTTEKFAGGSFAVTAP